ncbi:MAG: VOC family protein [Thermomicrobiales bacterium]
MSGHFICHVDISANDQEESGKFYESLFGWKIHPQPQQNYTTFAAEDGPGGGFSRVGNGITQAGAVLVYVSTDDIDASLAKAESLGGKIVLPKTELPGAGWMGVFTDPTGNHIGLYTNQ